MRILIALTMTATRVFWERFLSTRRNTNPEKAMHSSIQSSSFGLPLASQEVRVIAAVGNVTAQPLAMVEVAIAKRNGAQIKHGLEL